MHIYSVCNGKLTFAVFVKSCCLARLHQNSCHMLFEYSIWFLQKLAEDSWTGTSIAMKNSRLHRCTVGRMAKHKWTKKYNKSVHTHTRTHQIFFRIFRFIVQLFPYDLIFLNISFQLSAHSILTCSNLFRS